MRRFIAMHKTEAGFSSTVEVEHYISRMGIPEDWRIIEIPIDPVTEKVAANELAEAVKSAKMMGIQQERERIRNMLWLNHD